VCYEVEDKIFSGDTLFRDTYGRTDFHDGSFGQLKNSIVNKLFNLKGEYTVYPGHGVPTKLDYERKHNMVLVKD
ncbi:MAG: MBL fold metallo-hydrolase, partial [Clostridia bacterium]|nr:MBL fold metallo-hydrolase [Clostridia bacterium]